MSSQEDDLNAMANNLFSAMWDVVSEPEIDIEEHDFAAVMLAAGSAFLGRTLYNIAQYNVRTTGCSKVVMANIEAAMEEAFNQHLSEGDPDIAKEAIANCHTILRQLSSHSSQVQPARVLSIVPKGIA